MDISEHQGIGIALGDEKCNLRLTSINCKRGTLSILASGYAFSPVDDICNNVLSEFNIISPRPPYCFYISPVPRVLILLWSESAAEGPDASLSLMRRSMKRLLSILAPISDPPETGSRCSTAENVERRRNRFHPEAPVRSLSF